MSGGECIVFRNNHFVESLSTESTSYQGYALLPPPHASPRSRGFLLPGSPAPAPVSLPPVTTSGCVLRVLRILDPVQCWSRQAEGNCNAEIIVTNNFRLSGSSGPHGDREQRAGCSVGCVVSPPVLALAVP